MKKRLPVAYWPAIHAIPYVCLGGVIVMLVGVITRIPWVQHVGSGLILLSFAIWGLANGAAFLWQSICDIRHDGFRKFLADPGLVAVRIMMTALTVSFGVLLLWLALKASVFPR